MVKKVLAILVVLMMIISLTACGGDALYDKKSTEATSASEADENLKSISSYPKTIEGIEQCLVDRGLFTEDVVGKRSEMRYDLIGAVKGYRYTINSNAFVEIYEYPETLNATADEVKSTISKDGTFSIADMDPLTGVYSTDGKFLLIYNAKINFDGYEKIADVIKQF